MKRVSIVLFSILSILSTSTFANNLSGKTIEWIIPYKAGGGTGKWARFYAPLLSKNLPGQPKINIKYISGKGGTKGANWFAENAKPDGLTILGTSGSTQFPYLLDDPKVKYDYNDWTVLLASATGGVVYLPPNLHKLWEKKPQELIKNGNFIYGSHGPTGLDLVSLLAFDMLGMKVHPIGGFKGRSATRAMFKAGAVNIDYQTSPSFLSNVMPLVKEGKAVPIMTWGALDKNGKIVRDPTFPNIPTFKEVYTKIKGKQPSGEAWHAWKAFFIAGFSSQKMIFIPKGTSPKIVTMFETAFKKIISEPDFPQASKKRLGVYPQSIGNDAKERLVKGIFVSEAAKLWVRQWLQKKYNVKL